MPQMPAGHTGQGGQTSSISTGRARSTAPVLPRAAALVYCRVSTSRQAEEGTSLDSQETACVKHAEERGYRVARVSREVFSGAELWDRPLLSRDRADLKDGQFDALIAYATDRLSRDPIHLALIAEECARQNVALHFVSEPLDTSPEGQLIQYVKGYASKLEREKIRERQLRGKITRARTGRIHNYGPDLYGYRRDKAAAIRTIYEPEAAIVREIYRWVADERVPMRAVARRLNERGVPPPSAGKCTYADHRQARWGKNQVLRLLHNPAYKGDTVAWRWQRVGKNGLAVPRPAEDYIHLPEGVTPAIVPPEQWERAQRALAGRQNEGNHHATHAYLLTGYIWCARCGNRMQANLESAHTPHEMRTYRCSSRDKACGACGAKRVPADAVEAWVWERIATVLRDPETVAAEVKRRQERGPDATLAADLDTARRSAARCERKQGELMQRYDPDKTTFPWELVEREVKRLEDERIRWQKQAQTIEQRIADQARGVEQMASLKEYCARVAYNLDTFTFEEQRLALEALQVRVTANGRMWALTGAIPLDIPSGQDIAAATSESSHNISRLCPPEAATSSARLTCSCPRTSAKSKAYAASSSPASSETSPANGAMRSSPRRCPMSCASVSTG